MRSLVYKTGRTKTLVGSGSITLYHCGGVSVSGGWAGPGYFHPTTFISEQIQYHWIEVATVAGNVRIQTGVALGPNPTHPGDSANSYWLTRVSAPDFEKNWYNDADATSPYNSPPPPTITIHFSFKLPCEEWFWEEFPTIRPNSAYAVTGHFALKPTGKAQLTISGPGISHTSSVDAQTSIHPDRFGFLLDSPYGEDSSYVMSFAASSNNPFPTDLPFPTDYASASNMENDGQRWIIGTGSEAVYQTEFRARQERNGQAALEAIGIADSSVNINAQLRDWVRRVNGVRVSFEFDAATYEPGTVSGLIKTSPFDSLLIPFFRPADLIAQGYSFFDSFSGIIQWFPSYPALTLDRFSSLKVFNFVEIPPVDSGDPAGLYDWTEHNCTTTTSGLQRTVTATGGGAYIERTLKNDFLMMQGDPATWFATHLGELTSRVRDWYNGQGGGPSINLDNGGEWVRIGKRLRPTSDIFNWSAYRYAYLSAKADSECEITLSITYHNLTILSGGFVSLPERTVEYSISLGTTLQSHEIDLPSRPPNSFTEIVGHDGLKIIKSIKILVPEDRVITLGEIVLREKSRPKIMVHHSGSNDRGTPGDNLERATLSAIGDGKHILFLNSNYVFRGGGYPANTWGQTTKQYYGEFRTSSITVRQLANEIDLQEGWTATAHPHYPNFATDLQEVFEANLPTTLYGRRCYLNVSVYPRSGLTLDLIANFGTAVHGLIFDPDTHLPVRAKVQAVSKEGVVLDTQVADSKGSFRLELKGWPTFVLKSSPGTSEERTYPEPFGGIQEDYFIGESRTLLFAGMPGKVVTEESQGPPVLDVDFLGNRFVTFVKEGKINLGREFGSETEFKILEYDAIGNEVWLHNNQFDSENPLFLIWRESPDTLVLARNNFLGEGVSKLVVVGNGSFPVIRFDKYSSNILYISYFRDDAVYLKHTADYGATFLKWRDGTEEKKIMDATVAAPYTFDWLHDDSHTLIVAYMEEDVIKLKKSSDHGETWE